MADCQATGHKKKNGREREKQQEAEQSKQTSSKTRNCFLCLSNLQIDVGNDLSICRIICAIWFVSACPELCNLVSPAAAAGGWEEEEVRNLRLLGMQH